jgi:hypothetical protein
MAGIDTNTLHWLSGFAPSHMTMPQRHGIAAQVYYAGTELLLAPKVPKFRF